jgi:hypothetical protein
MISAEQIAINPPLEVRNQIGVPLARNVIVTKVPLSATLTTSSYVAANQRNTSNVSTNGDRYARLSAQGVLLVPVSRWTTRPKRSAPHAANS